MSGNSGMLGGLGAACYRHRWLTVVVWIVGVACLITLWTRFGAAADNSFAGSDPGQALLNEHFAAQSGDTLTLAIRSAEKISSPGVQERVTAALAPFRAAPHVTGVSNLHVAVDGHIAYATVQFNIQGSDIPGSEATALINDAKTASGNGVTFSLGGDVVDLAETPYGGASNGIGVGAAAIVLLIAFGSLLAMGLPIATALMGIGSGLALIALLGHVFPAPSFSAIVAALIGLGVGVDYALFIVTRFRQELRGVPGGRPPGPAQRSELQGGAPAEQAVVTAMRTAGRAVLTAGTTVIIGMLGLLVLRQTLLNGVAIAAAATVAMTVIAALTLLPALLGFTGTRLAKPSRLNTFLGGKVFGGKVFGGGAPRSTGVPEARTPVRSGEKNSTHPAERWARVVQGHPVLATVASAALILLLAAPALAMKLSMPDESAQARGTMGYASYATMAQGFGPGFDAPLIVAAKVTPADTARLTALRAAIEGTPGIADVTPPVISRDGQAALMIAYPTTGEQDAATNALVNRLEDAILPRSGLTAYLTGPNAGNVSFANLINERLPWLIGVVVALSLVLLLVVFRSVVIAVKAALMNLLSVCAAYGVLTAVTQWGWLGRLFGFPEKMPVTTWVPVFLFVILFGLSMDYEVFLLSKIREEYDRLGSNSLAVGRGLAATARVISAAAAIMVVVFLSFDLTPDVSVKQIGLGLAAAVLVDATVVRLVLVPAVMELLGKANWWLPGWLDRLLPARRLDEAGAGSRRTRAPSLDIG
ncbi:MAG TPA: MMPL family transporter [Streptosporangiaceae bacterium]|nr:MMPL family transporter [Streptosporangiaceae bacterium]